ncbi:MAG: hypothetical protein KKH88_00040 [Nanoarchaeota archaeon]|nr:hypothetical protein [Nanoarchaeota archaeon]
MDDSKRPWLYDVVREGLEGIDGVRVLDEFDIPFDKWFVKGRVGNSIPVLCKRGEIVIEREMETKEYLWGVIKLRVPKVSLSEISDRLASNSEIGQPTSNGTYLTYQRKITDAFPMNSFHAQGNGFYKAMEHVEVRETPALRKEFAARFRH